jgi:hypothetical protein
VESRYALLYEVRSSRIARLTLDTEPGEALAAAGLPR